MHIHTVTNILYTHTHTHTHTFFPQLREHIRPLSRLEDRGTPAEQRVHEPPTLQEGRGLSPDGLPVVEHTQSIHVLVLADMLRAVHLKQRDT